MDAMCPVSFRTEIAFFAAHGPCPCLSLSTIIHVYLLGLFACHLSEPWLFPLMYNPSFLYTEHRSFPQRDIVFKSSLRPLGDISIRVFAHLDEPMIPATILAIFSALSYPDIIWHLYPLSSSISAFGFSPIRILLPSF
jgi:hypothetical protein